MARKRIGEPLTFMNLQELEYIHGNLDALPQADSPGSWSATYRLFITKGYTSLATSLVGQAYVTKQNTDDGSTVVLNVDSFICNENPGEDEPPHQTTADIRCKNDALRTLLSYRAESVFRQPDGKTMGNITNKIDVKVDNGRLSGTAGKLKLSHYSPEPLSSYWSLFDAVCTIDHSDLADASLAVFEDSGIVRPQQRLKYHGASQFPADTGPIKVHRFSRLGTGVLPVEYWVDDQQRLLAMISSALIAVCEPLVIEPLPEALQATITRLHKG